jgi:hypothetical protein
MPAPLRYWPLAMSSSQTCRYDLLVCALLLLSGCGGDGSADKASKDGASAASSNEFDRCALLTKDDVAKAVGPNDGGSTGVENTWGTRSCRWTATRAQKIEGFPEWHDAIEVAVFEAAEVPMIRQQVKGDPVAGVAPGATYDQSYGDVWFDCAAGRLCAVKVRTASSDGRKDTAIQLARLVHSRVH